MRADEDAFLRAIQDDPNDDTARLVFADWLDENGEPERAEFVRVQIERGGLSRGDLREHELEDREKELWAKNRAAWLMPLPKVPFAEFEFRRGLPSGIVVGSWEDFLPRLPNVLGEFPVTDLTLRSLRYQWTESGGGPPTGGEIDDQRAMALRTLGEQKCLSQVSTLRMAQLGITDHSIQGLLSSVNTKRLTTLDLGGNAMTLQTLARVLRGALPSLRHLRFRKNSVGYEPRPVTDLPASDFRLDSVDLSELQLGSEHLQLLMRSPALSRLKSLHLDQNAIGPQTFKLLARGEPFPELEVLSLYLNQLGDDGARVLAQAPFRRHLRYLDLGYNQVQEFGLRALARDEEFLALRELNLNLNGFGDSIRELSNWPCLGNVTTLHLQATGIGPVGADALARSPMVENLVWLDLRNNRLSDEGIKSLARSPHLKNLRWLSVTSNQIGPDGANALIDSPYLVNLRSLDIWGNRFSTGLNERLVERFGTGVVV